MIWGLSWFKCMTSHRNDGMYITAIFTFENESNDTLVASDCQMVPSSNDTVKLSVNLSEPSTPTDSKGSIIDQINTIEQQDTIEEQIWRTHESTNNEKIIVLSGATKKRFKWLLSKGHHIEEVRKLAVSPIQRRSDANSGKRVQSSENTSNLSRKCMSLRVPVLVHWITRHIPISVGSSHPTTKPMDKKRTPYFKLAGSVKLAIIPMDFQNFGQSLGWLPGWRLVEFR